MAELADLLRGVADGTPPAIDSNLTVVPPPDERSVGVLAFPGQNIIVADVSTEWVRSWLSTDDLSEPFGPPFLTVLSAVTGRAVGNIDAVVVARAHGRRRGLELTEITDSDHPRIDRAKRYRVDVRAWECPGGLLVIGRGVAGRWEVAVEVEAPLRGFGLGRGLFGAALGLLPEGESLWAQVAPGNAASMRALLASGYHHVGAEVLLEPRAESAEGEPVEWFGSYLPVEEWQDAEDEWEDDQPEPAPLEATAQADQPQPPEPQPPHESQPSEKAAAEPPPADEFDEEAPFEPVNFRLPPIEPQAMAPRPVAGDRRPMETHATPAELAAAEAEAAAELDADEDTELTEHDEPHS